MKRLYLLLAIVGAVVPYIFFVQRFINEGLSPHALRHGVIRKSGGRGGRFRFADYLVHTPDCGDLRALSKPSTKPAAVRPS